MIETNLEIGSAPGVQIPAERAGSGRQLPNPVALGASLYLPATRADLGEILAGGRLGGVRSLIVCLEDSISEADVGPALENLRLALAEMPAGKMLRFLRPRSPGILAAVKSFAGFERLDGVVLPKVTPASLGAYAKLLESFPDMPIQPILETDHVFSSTKLEKIAHALEQLPHPVTAIRIGGNDILNLLGIRRPRGLTAYETPLRDAVVRILAVFRPRGYAVAAPVYEHFGDLETLRREVALDVNYGLTTKSAIHPSQLRVIEEAYAPTCAELVEASKISEASSPAVFNLHGSMCEPATHRRWAAEVIARATVFGVRSESETPL